jgi:hypothetical protein
MEDNLNCLAKSKKNLICLAKWKTTSIFCKMDDYLSYKEIEDELEFKLNGRPLHNLNLKENEIKPLF